jgi:hypothetical protein
MTNTCNLNKVYVLIISANTTNYNFEISPWYCLSASTLHIAVESAPMHGQPWDNALRQRQIGSLDAY